jgi:hypothetical protein
MRVSARRSFAPLCPPSCESGRTARAREPARTAWTATSSRLSQGVGRRQDVLVESQCPDQRIAQRAAGGAVEVDVEPDARADTVPAAARDQTALFQSCQESLAFPTRKSELGAAGRRECAVTRTRATKTASSRRPARPTAIPRVLACSRAWPRAAMSEEGLEPRHADYDSARSDDRNRKGLQIDAFISRENTSEYAISGSVWAYSGSIRGRFPGRFAGRQRQRKRRVRRSLRRSTAPGSRRLQGPGNMRQPG